MVHQDFKLKEFRGYSLGILFGMVGYVLYEELKLISSFDVYNFISLVLFLSFGGFIAHRIITLLGEKFS